MDIDKVVIGEYWLGIKVKLFGLIDDIIILDDYIFFYYFVCEIFSVKYVVKKNVVEKLGMFVVNVVECVFMKLMSKVCYWF